MAAKVIVLEDDPQIVSAFERLFRAERIEAVFFERPDDAREYLARNSVRTLIVDCLLPGLSGIDFVTSIRKNLSENVLDVVLMSGVFTEGSFVRDAMRSTKAVAFLKKPFPVTDILPFLKAPEQSAAQEVIPRKSLYQIFGKVGVTPRQRKKTIEALEELHGYDLPFLYALLVETEASGHLNIINDKDKVYGISFANGSIVGADIPDEDTFIGRLLIESGYITPEELEFILPKKTPKFLGERLIHYHLISPHLFEEVLSRQTFLRLTRTISNENVRMNFVEADVEPTVQQIVPEDFLSILHDWAASKVTADWLAAHFTPWGNSRLKKNPSSKNEQRVREMALISHDDKIFSFITSGLSINQMIESRSFPEGSLYKAIYFLLTSGVVTFSEQSDQQGAGDRSSFLQKTHLQLMASDTTEALNALLAMTRTTAARPQIVFQEFMQFIGEEPSSKESELRALYQQILQRVQQLTQYMSTPEYSQAQKSGQQGSAEKRILAMRLFEEAQQSLVKSQFKEAQERLKKVAELDRKISGLAVLKAWSKLGGIEMNPAKLSIIKEVELDLLQIEPEEKLDAYYSFVQGLLYKAKGDYVAGKKSFEKALSLDSNLLVARREISLMQSLSKKQPDLLNSDIRSIVGSFFGKK